MLDVFGNLRLLVKRRLVVIDNNVFRLHWFFTASILTAFSIVVTARQYVGEPIHCFKVSDAPPALLNTYCWVHATFTMKDSFNKRVGFDIPHPGIDNSRGGDKKYYPYYQWVCFVLFLQAMFFYVPHYIWKVWESGLLEAISVGLTAPILVDEERRKRVQLLTDYLQRSVGNHKWYAIKYFGCEVLCLLNVLGQMWLLDRFFDGEFWNFGSDVINYSQSNQVGRTDPMIYVFPRMTKCSFYSYGPSGDVQTHDTLCILPMNVINEKIFIFLWFWFVILTVITGLQLVQRVFVFAVPPVRICFLHEKCKLAKKEGLDYLLKESDVGDWFMIYMLGMNLDSLVFKDVVAVLVKNKRKEKQSSHKVSKEKFDKASYKESSEVESLA